MHGGKIFEHQKDSDHCYSGCADGKITTELINGYEKRDEKVAKLETEWVRTVKDSLETKFAFLPFDFTLFDPEDPYRPVFVIRRKSTLQSSGTANGERILC